MKSRLRMRSPGIYGGSHHSTKHRIIIHRPLSAHVPDKLVYPLNAGQMDGPSLSKPSS